MMFEICEGIQIKKRIICVNAFLKFVKKLYILLQFLPKQGKKRESSKTDVYRVIEDQIDLSMVSYGMRVRWSMHPSSVQFRVVDLQRRIKNNQENK